MRNGFRALLFVLSATSMVAAEAFGQEPVLERPMISGRVVDEQNRPVPGADVYWCPIEPYQDRPGGTLHATPDDQGQFQLEAPDTFKVAADEERIGRIWAVAQGRALEAVTASGFRWQEGKPRFGNITLTSAGRFAVRVVDPDERPRAGELVELNHYVIEEENLQTSVPMAVSQRLAGVTDDNGECQIEYLKPRTRVAFRVVSEQFGMQEESGAEERGIVPVLTFGLRPTGRLEGSTIGDNEKAFAGMRLSLMTFSPRDVEARNPGEVGHLTFRASTVVGEDGRFAVAAIGPGVLRVIVEHERTGGPREPVVVAPMNVAPGTTGSLTLEPQATTVFKGIVVTEGTNKPVANAQVTISGGRRRALAVAQTDTRGQYSITGLAVDSQLQASIGVVESRDVVEVPASPGLKEVACPPIKLPPTRTISGRLFDSAGQPVADAEVAGLEVAIHHGKATTSKEGRFEMLTAAERTITDYAIQLNGNSRTFTTRSREPLELVLDEPAKKQ